MREAVCPAGILQLMNTHMYVYIYPYYNVKSQEVQNKTASLKQLEKKLSVRLFI